jgi:hypothetical protein
MLNEDIALVPVDEADEALVVDEALEKLVSPAPVLITEQEVVLGTAVALQAPPKTRRRWRESVHVLLAAIQRAAAPPVPAERRPRHDYPRQYAFLENACMAREMGRL